MLSSAYTSGYLIAKVGPRPVLGLMAFFPLLMCLTAGLIREQRQQDSMPSMPEAPRPGVGECTCRLGAHVRTCCHSVWHKGSLSACLTVHSSIVCGGASSKQGMRMAEALRQMHASGI